MLTIEGALQHLGYEKDEIDEVIRANVTAELEGVKSYLQGAVGADVFDLLPDHPTVESLLRVYLDDIHDERGLSAKSSGAKREMVHSQEWQLRLELARRRAETEGASV